MKRRNIIIDLTALLDVILILFFAVMIRARQTAATEIAGAHAAASAAITQRDAAVERADALSRMLHTEDILLDNNLVVTLSVGRDEELVIESGGETVTSVPYMAQENTYEYEPFRNTFRLLANGFREDVRQSQASGDLGMFVVFQYDSGVIRKGQYDTVESFIRRLRSEGVTRGISFNFIEMDIK